MENKELHNLLEELKIIEEEQPWLEFKLNKSSSNAEIGEYISAISNGASIKNKDFGYLIWGVEDITHKIKGTDFFLYLIIQIQTEIMLFWKYMVILLMKTILKS